MGLQRILIFLFLNFPAFWGWGQDLAYNDNSDVPYAKAYDMAYDGDYKSASASLAEIVTRNPQNMQALTLLARTYSWSGQYDKARALFNKVIAAERNKRDVWIAAVKNELYAKNSHTALGLANKALSFVEGDGELERLREIALTSIKSQNYSELNWSDVKTTLKSSTALVPKKVVKANDKNIQKENVEKIAVEPVSGETAKAKEAEKAPKNRLAIANSFTIFDQRYDPMVFSSISLRRQTLAGSIIPRINYSNRLGQHGVQYDMDFYPKFSKRFYAYMNYGFSNSPIYPKHNLGGDLYANLPGSFEFSAGGRFISFATRDVTVVTNSFGHYRGNYYFSLRSFITPQPNNLTRVSGSLLVRKYLKDGENFYGVNFGMGYAPELRQLVSGGELLAETLLYIESQRLSFEYQFTPKKSPNIYRTNMGLTRQELAFDSGNFFWSVSAGLTYQVKF
ncbi:MAG: YaiO family outer membrane beta-barrel protein [Flavobacteriaceae bacterium]